MIENRLVAANRRSQWYERFSDDEYKRRYADVRSLMEQDDLDAIIVYGNGGLMTGNQTNVEYLTNYRGEFITYVVFFADPAVPPTLYCGLSNHLQYLREVSVVDDIRLMIPDPPRKLVGRLEEGGVGSGRIGLVSLDPRYQYSIPHEHYETLRREIDGELVDFTQRFVELHAVKSDAELERLRRGAELTDAGMEALVDAIEPGVREYELEAALKHAYLKEGGDENFTFINSAPMADAEPGEAVTWKQPSAREVEEGDIVTTEFSAAFGGYSGQIHRPIAVGQPPTDEYREMWEIARETYDAMLDAVRAGNTAGDVAEAVAPIEESEYKIYDVLLHGYGNGYLHPFIGTRDSNYWPGGADPVTADWTFEENMVVVIQPNVLSEDETKGFQLGTTLVVRDGSPEVLQKYPVEFVRA